MSITHFFFPHVEQTGVVGFISGSLRALEALVVLRALELPAIAEAPLLGSFQLRAVETFLVLGTLPFLADRAQVFWLQHIFQ